MATTPVTDYRVLAALAHPLRRRVLDLLRVEGPQTASLLAGRTGSAVGNLSHHLKVLASHGLVVPAPELARDGRERWWRAGSSALNWDSRDFAGDPAGEAAAQASAWLALERQVGYVRTSLEREADGEPDWDGFNTDTFLRLSQDELAELGREVVALVDRWRERELPDDGVDRAPVFVLARGFRADP